MLRTQRFLLPAFCVSLLIHAAPFLTGDWLAGKAPPTPPPPPLQAQLQVAPPLPELIVPETPKPQTEKPATRPRQAAASGNASRAQPWTRAIREQFARQQQSGQFYPAEAIRLGLEGEALVFMMLDADGNVVAARIEASSGHELLDRAALDAVRRLRSLPAEAPQEVLLPVGFRLH